MHKNTTKCNKTQSKWCINKHGASKIIDTFETYQRPAARVQRLYKAPPPPCTPATHTRHRSASTPYENTMKGRWPFSRKTKHDGEASGSASRDRDCASRDLDRRQMPPLHQLCPSPAALLPNGRIHAAARTRRGHRVHRGPCATASTCRSSLLFRSTPTANSSLGQT
jgi:hypothetical protein